MKIKEDSYCLSFFGKMFGKLFNNHFGYKNSPDREKFKYINELDPYNDMSSNFEEQNQLDITKNIRYKIIRGRGGPINI